MPKQRLEELLATYRELNPAQRQELERSVVEYSEYVTRLERFRQLDHALQQAGEQNLATIQSKQARLNHICRRVMQQREHPRSWWLALLGMAWANISRQWQSVAMAGALLLMALFVYSLVGRSEWLAAIVNQENGSITTAPGDVARPPHKQPAISLLTPTPSEPVATSTVSTTNLSVVTNSVTISGSTSPGFTSPGFAFGIEAQLLDGAATVVFSATERLGFSWIRQTIHWEDFQPTAEGMSRTPIPLDAVDWSELSTIVQSAQAHKINLLVTVVNAPAWAREVGFDPDVPGPAANPQDYAAFVAALANEFCGSALHAIEIWHGQNLHYNWGNQAPNPVAYVQMLRAAYLAIKSACPTMLVISGAPIPAGNNMPLAMDDLEYMEAVYEAGLAAYADGIGAHHDGYNVPATVRWEEACEAIQQTGRRFNGPCDAPHHSWSLRSTLESYREIMVRHADEETRIWPTSFGWPAGGETNPAYRPSYKHALDNDRHEQAKWSVEAYRMMREWSWIGPAFLNNLNVSIVTADRPEAMWSILQGDYAALPVFASLQSLARGPDAEFFTAACGDPRSAIHAPAANEVLSGTRPIRGVATADEFQFYKLEIAPGAGSMGGFTYFGGGQNEVGGGVLGMLDSISLPNGEYTIRLTVVNEVGNFLPPCDVTLTIQN